MHKSIQLIVGLAGFWVIAPALLSQADTTPPSAPAVPANKLGLGLNTTAGFIPAQLERSRFPFEGRRNVFGKDERIPMNSSKHPWSAIGRIEIPVNATTTNICTGSLIGKNLVVTNAHCVLDKKTKQVTTNKIRFRPNLIGGQAPAAAFATKVVLGTTDPRNDRGNDWAFLVLDKPLGATHGTLKILLNDAFLDLDQIKGQINLAGYSSDFPKDMPAATAGVHKGCSIRGFGSQLGTVSHDCDMMAGASGGPMFMWLPDGSAVILALNAAERVSPEGKTPPAFSRQTANIGVYAATWAGKANELLKAQQ